jgi:GDP-L-fucose synthase
MPTNLYGINDNFYSKDSHVIPALIARFHEAKLNKSDEVVIWGTGSVSREFMFVDDMAEASFFVLTMDKNEYLLNTQQQISHINIGTGKDITISELATIIKDVVGFKGKLVFDKSMPDGAPKKLTSVERINGMGWKSKTNLRDGLNLTYSWFLKNYKNHQ